jgi:hypothetical protein
LDWVVKQHQLRDCSSRKSVSLRETYRLCLRL